MSTMKKISQEYTKSNETQENTQKGDLAMKRFNLPLALQALSTMSPSPLRSFLETEVAYHLKAEEDKKRKQKEEEKARAAEMRKAAEREKQLTEERQRQAAAQATAEESLLDGLFFLFAEEAPILEEKRKDEEAAKKKAEEEAKKKAEEEFEIALARAVAEAGVEAAREARAAKAISRKGTTAPTPAPRHGISPVKAKARFEANHALQIAEGRKGQIMKWIKSLRSPAAPVSPIASLPLDAPARKVMALGVNLRGFAILPAPAKVTRRPSVKARRAVAKITNKKGDGLKKMAKKAGRSCFKQIILMAIDQVKNQRHLTAQERQLVLMGDAKKAVKALVNREFTKQLSEASAFVSKQHHLTAYERQLVLMGRVSKAAKVFMARGFSRLNTNGADMIKTAEIKLPVFMSSEFPQDPGITMPGDIFVSNETAKAMHLLGQNRLPSEAVVGIALVDNGSANLQPKKIVAFHGSELPGRHDSQEWFLPILEEVDLVLCCNWGIALPQEFQHKAVPMWHSRVTGENKGKVLKVKATTEQHHVLFSTDHRGPDANKIEWVQEFKNEPLFGTDLLGAKVGVLSDRSSLEIFETLKKNIQAALPGNYEDKCFSIEDDCIKIQGFNVDIDLRIQPLENVMIIWNTPTFHCNFDALFGTILREVFFKETPKASRITFYDFANKQALSWFCEWLANSKFVRDETALVEDEIAQWYKMADSKNRAEKIHEMMPELPAEFVVKTTFDKTVNLRELNLSLDKHAIEMIESSGIEIPGRTLEKKLVFGVAKAENRLEILISQFENGGLVELVRGPAKIGWFQKLLQTGSGKVDSKLNAKFEEDFSKVCKAIRKEEVSVTWYRQDDILAGYLPENGSDFVKKNGASCQDFATTPINENFKCQWKTEFGTFWTKHDSNPHIYNWLSFFNVAKMYVLKGKKGEILGRTMLYQLENGMALGEFYGDVSMKSNHNSLYAHLENLYGDVEVDSVAMPFSSSRGSLPYIDVDPRFQYTGQPGNGEEFVRFTYKGFNTMKKILIGHKDEILAMDKNEIQNYEYVLCCDREFVAQEIGLKPYGDTKKFPRCFRNENGTAFLADADAKKFVVLCEGVDFEIPFAPENLVELGLDPATACIATSLIWMLAKVLKSLRAKRLSNSLKKKASAPKITQNVVKLETMKGPIFYGMFPQGFAMADVDILGEDHRGQSATVRNHEEAVDACRRCLEAFRYYIQVSGYRIWKTKGGARLMIDTPETSFASALLQELLLAGADPLYLKATHAQQTYNVRMSPKWISKGVIRKEDYILVEGMGEAPFSDKIMEIANSFNLAGWDQTASAILSDWPIIFRNSDENLHGLGSLLESRDDMFLFEKNGRLSLVGHALDKRVPEVLSFLNTRIAQIFTCNPERMKGLSMPIIDGEVKWFSPLYRCVVICATKPAWGREWIKLGTKSHYDGYLLVDDSMPAPSQDQGVLGDFAIPFKPENLEELNSSDSPDSEALHLNLPSGDEDIQQNNETSKKNIQAALPQRLMDSIEKNDLALFQQLLAKPEQDTAFLSGKHWALFQQLLDERKAFFARFDASWRFVPGHLNGPINGRPFLIMERAVTREQFIQHCRAHNLPLPAGFRAKAATFEEPQNPISRISWWDAQRFAEAQSLQIPSLEQMLKAREGTLLTTTGHSAFWPAQPSFAEWTTTANDRRSQLIQIFSPQNAVKKHRQRDEIDAELTFRCIYVLDPRRSLFERALAQQKHLSLKSLFSFCVLHLHGVAEALHLNLPSGDEDIQQNEQEQNMTLKSNVTMLKIRSKRGKVSFDPKGQVKKVTEKFATVMKQVGDSESSYIDAGGRLAVPCYGVVELDGRKQVVRVQDMIMDGFPLQGWALKTGEIPARLLPTLSTTAPSDSELVLAHLERSPRELYFNRTFFWATRSWFASLFFKEGRVKAGDIYSRMPSFAKAKTAVFTKERGTKTYFGSIENQVKFFEALCRESLFAGSSPEEIRANMILAAEQIGVTFEFVGSTLEVTNVQTNGEKSEMDGMSLMGHKAKSHVLKSTRPYQGRALARMDKTWYDLIAFIDNLCNINELTGEPTLVDLDADVKLPVASFYDQLFQMVDYNNGKWTLSGDTTVEKLLPPLQANFWILQHGRGKVLRPETMLVQMVKGLFRPSSWLKANVIIWDLNSVKDSSKDAVKKAVKKHGIVKAHEDADHVHAFLQDLGLGSMRFGTQPAQYAADIMEDGSNCIAYAQENWTEILSAPVKKITLIESLKGSEEVSFDDFRSIKEVLSLKSSLELGGEDDTDTSDMDADQSDAIVEQMSAIEAQFAAYYTDKTYRSQLLDQFKSLMVELRMNLISEGMKRAALKLPVCDYVVDWNDLPASYVNNRVTSSGHESKLLREVFGDLYQGGADQIQIMIEGRLRPIPVIGLASSWFWDKFGAEKDFCFGLAFRYPVANRDMIVPALVLNLTKLRGIEPGIYTHTITQKEYFCGDTDGDRNAILPLDVDFTMTNKVISFKETKDYGLVRAFGLRSDAKQVEIEGLVGGAQVAYFSMQPGITERFLGATGKLIGGVALLQQAAKGLVDTKDQLLSSNFEGGEVFESGKITHSFASFLGVVLGFKAGHYQGGDTKSDLRHSSYSDQVKAIRDLLTIEERRELLEWLFKDIIVPYLILSPGLLEVAISAQKKDLTQVYRNLVMNFLTVGDFLQGEGRDTLKLRDQENQYRVSMLGQTNDFDLGIFSLAAMSQEAPSWLVGKSAQGMGEVAKELVERSFCSRLIGGLNPFANEEWLVNRRSREAFQKATGFDFHRAWMFSQAIRAQGPKRQIQNAVSLALVGFMMPSIMGFDIQFNSHLGMIIRDLLQITGANVDGKAVQWIEALRLSDIEKLSNDKMKALYLEDKSWGILKEDNLDWSISRWTQKNSAVFSEIKKDLEDWMNGRVVSFDKKNREQASLLASGDFIGNLRANNLVAFGSDQGLRSAASLVFNHMEKEGRSIQGWDLAAKEFGIDSHLVAEMFCVPSLMKTWTNGRSSAEQREAIRQFSQNVPSWVKDAVESVARIILLKREAATLKLKISTPAIYGDKTKTVIDSQEVESGLLVLLDDAEKDVRGLTSGERQDLADWKIRLQKAKADTMTDRAYRTMASTWSAVNGAEAILAFAMMAFAQEQGCYELDEKTGLPAKLYVPKSNVITKETRGLFDQFAKNVIEARESDFFSVEDMRGLFAGVLPSFEGRTLANAQEDIRQLRHNAAQMMSEVSSIVGQGAMVFLLPFFSSGLLMEVMFASLFQVNWRQSGSRANRGAFNALRSNPLKGFQVKKVKNADCQIGIGEEAHEALHRVLFEGAKVCLLTVEGLADLSVLSNETFFDTIFVGSEALSMPEGVTYVQIPFHGFTVEKIEKLVGQHIVIGEGARQNERGFIFNALTHERIAGFVDGEMIISQNLETLCRQPITSIFSGLLTAESEIGTLMRFWVNQNDSETQVTDAIYAALRIASGIATQNFGGVESRYVMDAQAIEFHPFAWAAKKSPLAPRFWKAFSNIVSFDDFDNKAFPKIPSKQVIFQLASWWTRCSEKTNPFQVRIQAITREANEAKKSVPKSIMSVMYTVGVLGLNLEAAWESARDQALAFANKIGKPIDMSKVPDILLERMGISTESVHWTWLYDLIVKARLKSFSELLTSCSAFSILRQIGQEAISEIGITATTSSATVLKFDEETANKMSLGFEVSSTEAELSVETGGFPKWSLAKKNKATANFFVDQTKPMIVLDQKFRSIAEEVLVNENGTRTPSKGAAVPMSVVLRSEDGKQTKAVAAFQTGATALMSACVTDNQFTILSVRDGEAFGIQSGFSFDALVRQLELYLESKLFSTIKGGNFDLESIQGMIDGFVTGQAKVNMIINGGRRTVTLPVTIVLKDNVKWETKNGITTIKVPVTYLYKKLYKVSGLVTIKTVLEQDQNRPWFELTRKSKIAKLDELVTFEDDEVVISDGVQVEDSDLSYYDNMVDDEDDSWMPEHE